jgi:hypothetical protein
MVVWRQTLEFMNAPKGFSKTSIAGEESFIPPVFDFHRMTDVIARAQSCPKAAT